MKTMKIYQNEGEKISQRYMKEEEMDFFCYQKIPKKNQTIWLSIRTFTTCCRKIFELECREQCEY